MILSIGKKKQFLKKKHKKKSYKIKISKKWRIKNGKIMIKTF
jgi:hypothetical protein